MFCPNCGAEAHSEQKFCRACGLKLEKVTQLLQEQSATLAADLQGRSRLVERFRNLMAVGTGAILVATLALLFLYGLLAQRDPLEVMKIIIAVKILLGAGITAGLSLYLRALRKKLAVRRELSSGRAIPGQTTTELKLEAHLGALPSVTEQTTERLSPPRPVPVKR